MTSYDLPLLDFADAPAFEVWLASQPQGGRGAWIKFTKGEGRATSLAKSDAIDCALAHGWIDGRLGRVDERVYKVRFTPRRPGSAWSQVNRERVERLIGAGRMTSHGMAEVERAMADGRWDAAYPPQGRAAPDADLLAALAARPEARSFFDGLDCANRYAVLYRVHQARGPERRAAKIAEIVERLALGTAYHPPRKPRAANDRR
jgi:uncharacterized protein YdeI (YjbR/CyaY-like superfamily)